MQRLYLALCLIGTALPLAQFIPWLAEHGLHLPLMWQQIQADRLSAFAWADVVVSALALIPFVLAKRFHAAGNPVVLAGRRADALAEAARALPGAQTAVADITQPADRARLLQAHGDISILVNNAGIQINRPLLE